MDQETSFSQIFDSSNTDKAQPQDLSGSQEPDFTPSSTAVPISRPAVYDTGDLDRPRTRREPRRQSQCTLCALPAASAVHVVVGVPVSRKDVRAADPPPMAVPSTQQQWPGPCGWSSHTGPAAPWRVWIPAEPGGTRVPIATARRQMSNTPAPYKSGGRIYLSPATGRSSSALIHQGNPLQVEVCKRKLH